MATATYPPPPPFYKLYKEPESAPSPPPPIQGPYVIYGASYTTDDVLPGLEDQGVRQLYPKGPNIEVLEYEYQISMIAYDFVIQVFYEADDAFKNPGMRRAGCEHGWKKMTSFLLDFKKELKSLNRQLQLHLLELADVLVERPSQYARRVEDISLILKNLHHLLNSLRPHQARATLIHILEQQIERRKQAVEDITRRREEAQSLLKEALGTLDGQ